jgi:hypothetical protein
LKSKDYNFKALGKAVNAALTKYRNALKKLVHKTLRDLSAADPESMFEYTSGMGRWSFLRTGPCTHDDGSVSDSYEEDIEPEPVYSAILDAESEFDYSVVPDGIFVYKNKKRIAHGLPK